MSLKPAWAAWFARKRVAVLGASGFLGRRLTERLVPLAGEVVAFARGTATPALAALRGARVETGDVAVEQDVARAISGCDAVFVMAGISGAAASWEEPERSLAVNCGGLQNLLNACMRGGERPRIVFPSSRLVYDADAAIPVAEDAPLRPRSPYGLHKRLCEEMLALYADRHGVSYAAARLTNPYGSTTHPYARAYNVISMMIERAKAGADLTVFGEGTQLRDYIFIDDAVDALAHLATLQSNVVVNVGSGIGTPLGEVVEMIVAEAGSGRVVHEAWPERFAAVETGDFVADVRRARELGIAPARGILDGLRQTLDHEDRRSSAL